MRITTGDFARALQPDWRPATDNIVRGWCESGLLKACRNPLGGKYALDPESIQNDILLGLLLKHGEITRENVEVILSRLGISFRQFCLKISA